MPSSTAPESLATGPGVVAAVQTLARAGLLAVQYATEIHADGDARPSSTRPDRQRGVRTVTSDSSQRFPSESR